MLELQDSQAWAKPAGAGPAAPCAGAGGGGREGSCGGGMARGTAIGARMYAGPGCAQDRTLASLAKAANDTRRPSWDQTRWQPAWPEARAPLGLFHRQADGNRLEERREERCAALARGDGSRGGGGSRGAPAGRISIGTSPGSSRAPRGPAWLHAAPGGRAARGGRGWGPGSDQRSPLERMEAARQRAAARRPPAPGRRRRRQRHAASLAAARCPARVCCCADGCRRVRAAPPCRLPQP